MRNHEKKIVDCRSFFVRPYDRSPFSIIHFGITIQMKNEDSRRYVTAIYCSFCSKERTNEYIVFVGRQKQKKINK